MKTELLETLNNLDDLHSSYEALELLSVGSEYGESINVGRILNVLNKSLEIELDKCTKLVRHEDKTPLLKLQSNNY